MGQSINFIVISESPEGTNLDLTSLDKNSTTNTAQSHSACIFYKILDSASRNVATLEADSVCKSEDNQNPCCDKKGNSKVSPDWKGEGWYRYNFYSQCPPPIFLQWWWWWWEGFCLCMLGDTNVRVH